jgi:hypothetical protein
MNVLSAAQAVSPAIDRTKRLLFQPFRWSTYLKLAVVACITEGFSANLNHNFSHSDSSWPHGGGLTPFHLSPDLIALIVLAFLACFALCIFIFYLVTRLRFAFFHCLVHQTTEIRPGWRLYREQALRFFKVSLLIGLLLLGITISLMLPFAFKFFDIYSAVQAGGHLDPVRVFLLLLAFIPVALLLSLALWAVKVIMHDFMLPHVALDDASVEEAWAQVRSRIEAETGQFFVYMLLRLILPALAGIAVFLLLAIPALMIFGSLALSAAGIHALLAAETGLAAVIRIAFEALFGIIGACIALFLGITLGGPIATWIRNYALLFYGGRYKPLGDILSPPQPAAPESF